ncbi:zinc finger protein 407 isoform X20 [Scyliorhinus canicula]|uniref:zinc finger protein 407 isoform X20 n=1 Tax=Scyliorhinus canicula TaxID=7830 RepID=UPI0018F79C8E|nr:zinc finger protein 407 isoform X20 [Scyliorhinus canicula]
MDLNKEPDLVELPANEGRNGVGVPALGRSPQPGPARRCRRKAAAEPGDGKDPRAKGALEGKAARGGAEGGEGPCGGPPPAKRQRRDTLEQARGSRNVGTADGSALAPEEKPARAVTRHVQNDLKKVSAQLEGKPRDCQHRTKKIKVGGAWACPSCNFTKKNDTALKTDTNQRHSNDSYFVCDICNVTSSSKVNYRKHISSVLHKKQAKSISKDTSTKEGFNCRLCGRLLPSRYDLDKHIKENHSKRSKAHICPHCKFKAESAASLQAHLKHKHVREERLSCDLCGYQCYDENLLKTHCRGKTHLRRKNLAARGGYIHLLSKKGLSGEYDAKDKTESVKHLNKRSENLRTARNKGLAQKNAKGAKGLDKSTTTSKDLCVETVMGDEMPKANEQTELNNCSAGKATSRRTLRRVKEATDLPQVNRRLRRSAKGNNVSLRLRSARHNDDSEQSQSTRNRFSMEETGNRRSPRKLRGRANLLAMDDRRNRGRFPPRGEGFPEVKRSRGRIPGSKDHGVKPVSKTTAQISDHPEGKPEEQGRSSDANPSIANQEGENVVKVSCSGGTQEGESAPSEVPSPSSLVEKSAHSSSGNQNRDSPPANLPNNKAPKADNPESKLSPADREALRTCSYCGHLFQNRKGLEVHIKRRHTKEMVFHCQPCGYACVTKGDFEKHCQSNRHQTNFSNIDWLCSFVTSHDETLKDHVSQEPKAASYSQPGKPQPVSEEEPVDQGDTEHQIENIPPQEKESPAEQNQRLQLRGQELNKISSSGANVGPTVPKANPLFKDPQKPSIARVVAGNILRRSTHCRPQLQCKNCFYKARSATVLFKHIRLRHAQEYRFYCTVCSLYTISKEAMEKHIKRSRHIENAKKRNLGPSVEECVEEVSVGVQDVQKTMKAPGALGNVNTEIDKGCVQVLEPSKPKEEFVVTWEISEGDASSVENVQKSSDLQSAESSKRGRPKGNISRTCSYCGLLASSVTNLNIHIRRKHSHQYSYFCKACNYYTVTKGDMDRHCNTKKHKNRADVSKAVEVCRKIAAPPDKGNPQVIENDAVALSTAGGVESGSEAMEPEAPDVENPSRSTENCTRVNLEGHLSAQNQQKAENQNEVVVVLDVESNETAKDDSSSNCKQLKESHATTCAHCGFVAYSLATLELHVKRKHTKDFDYYCMACDYYAVTRREMMRHAFTEKHKLKSQAYVRLNLDKGHDTSTTIADAPGNGNQKEGSEDQMDKGSWNEEDEASKVAQDAAQEFALHVIESEKASGSHEQASASKQTAAVFEMAEKQDKCLQSEVTEEVDDSQTLPAVCHSEISPEADSGLLEANTSLSNASLDTESHPAELISMPVKSAVLETTQNQISEALIEEDSCRCCADIVTPQENDVSNNNIGLRAEASQTEVDDFQQLSQEDECQKDEQDVKLAEVAKEESPNLDSALNETVNPGESQPNTSGLAGGKEVQIECSPPVEDVEGSAVEDVEGSAVEDVEGSAVEDVEGSAVEDVEGSAVEDVEVEDVEGSAVEDVEGSAVEAGHDQQPGKNSEHIRINLAQQIDNNFEGVLETTTAEESVQGDADPPQDVRVDEALLDAQNKMEAALKEKNWNSKSANEMSQETESDALEVTESTGDGFAKLDSQGKGWQKHFEFDASIVRLKKKSWSEKSECTDNSEDSQGTDGISSNEWAVAVYKTDPSQVTRKRKTEGSLLQDSKRIRCEDCGFLADGVNGLNVHIAMKHPSAEKHFHCFLCGKSFYTESNLHQHLASVGHQRMEQESIEELPEGGATFKCVKCNTAFDSEQCLFVHIKQKHEEMVREVNKYIVEDTEQINCERQENQGNVCKYCGKVCKSSNSLAFLAHIRTHTGSKPFRCTLCNFATAQLGDARNHVKRHLGVREYKCHICGWAFVMKKHLSTHLLGKHGIGTPKERKFVCEICDRTFTEKWALTNHKKLHMGQKPFKCTWLTCHYSFLTASAMRDHFRTHTGEKSFLCDLCGFAGGTRHALTKHRRQHTGEKPFKCDQCHFASTTQSHLTRHRRVHTGEKPYMCPWCDYRSNCAENIRKHILHTGKHEGVKMYNCPKCEYGTNIPLEFRNHLKEYHPDIENPDLAYLHAGIVSKAYECRLKGQGAQFVETAVPFNTPQSTDCADVTDNALNDCSEQQEPTESIGQVIIIQGYQVGCGEDISIDASVEATAAATLQTLAMAGQMAQVAQVMHITEDGQLIATTQSAAHVGSMVPGQILTRQLTSGATQVVVVENRTEEGGVTEAAVALETLADSSHVIEQVVTQEESTVPASETPTALDALLCAVTELGEVEARSAEQEGSEPTQEESCVVSSAIEEVISAPKESICGAMEMFHKEETGHEARQTEAAEPGEMVSNIEQPMSVTTAGEESQVAFSDMVQEVLQFTMCDMRTTSHIVKDGITQVIVAKEGTAHMVEGGSQIIMQEGEEQTITTHGRPMRLVDSSGKISQIIITNEILQAMVQETGSDLSEETTHVIVTEVPHTVVNGDHTRAVTEVYPHSVMELISEDMSSSTHPVTTIALAECYTEDRSEIVMTELSAKEEQEMEVGGIQEA